MKWSVMKWNEMKGTELKWNEMNWNEMKWNEIKWTEMKKWWNENGGTALRGRVTMTLRNERNDCEWLGTTNMTKGEHYNCFETWIIGFIVHNLSNSTFWKLICELFRSWGTIFCCWTPSHYPVTCLLVFS